MTDTHDPEFYDLPSADDTDYWERFQAAGLHQPEQTPNGNQPHGWERLNLADPQYGIPSEPPAILGLLYDGKRHVISGPPESTKTLIAYRLLLEAMRNGWTVAIVDFEMGPTACRRLLEDIGATPDELANIHYYEPDTPPHNQWLALVIAGVRLVLIDAAIGSYDVSGLDDNARKDAEAWATAWIRPLYKAGVTTLTVDHVVKNADNRGKFTIGSERKLGGTDVHLSLESLSALHRGGKGVVKIHVHKDRPGHLPRPVAHVVEIESDPETHEITFDFRDPQPTDVAEGYYRPTTTMERISRWLEDEGGEWSQTQLEKAVKGKATAIRAAIVALRKEGHIVGTGSGTGHRYKHFSAYRAGTDPVPDGMHYPSHSEDPVPPRPTPVPSPASDPVPRPPPIGGTGRTDRLNVHDPAVQHLLDEPEF